MGGEIFNPAQVDEDRVFDLGTTLTDHLGEEYVYVEADAAITVNMVVVIEDDWGARGITTATAESGNIMAVAKVAIPNDEFGWVSRKGEGLITVAASCAADAILNTTTTAGRLDDSGGEASNGEIRLQAARGGSAGTAMARWAYPAMA